MEIKRLRHFRTVVEAGGLTQAAALLHITAGALSKSIQLLETETGQLLFDRSARRLQLTDAGSRLYHESNALMAEHARILRAMGTPSKHTDPGLRIASFEVFTTHLLGAVIDAGFAADMLHVLELPVRRICAAVAEREADLGITYAPFPRQGLGFREIGTARFHAYKRRGAFRDVAFEDLPFAVPTTSVEGSTAGLLGIDSWPYARVARYVKFELTSLESALVLARSGHCAVFLPSFLAVAVNTSAARRMALEAIEPPRKLGRVEQPIYAVTRSSHPKTPQSAAFLDKLIPLLK